MGVESIDPASMGEAAGVVRVSPVLVRLARAEVERHRLQGTEAPLGITTIAGARTVYAPRVPATAPATRSAPHEPLGSHPLGT